MKYFDELCKAMQWLGEQPDTVFIGQAVNCSGTAMYNTLKDVPVDKRYELPVFEEQQLGMSTGIALNGSCPVSIFPRWDFLILAANQLVNHLNRLKEYSNGEYNPKVITRVGVGASRPIYPSYQHVNDYTDAFQLMCNNIHVVKLEEPEQILPAYQEAYNREGSSILVEVSDFLNEK